MPLPQLDPVIHQPIRLQIMSLLSRNRHASFVWVRETLRLTDGNLGSHVARLSAAGYIESGKVLTASGFQVWLRMTPAGDDAFRAYCAALRGYLDQQTPG